MQLVFYIVSTIQVISTLGVLALVLLQQGKGAEASASFGGGGVSSGGGANALSKATAIAAAVFFASTLALTIVSTNASKASSVLLTAPLDAKAGEALPK